MNKTLALIAAMGLISAPAFANEASVSAEAKADKIVAGEAKADAKEATSEAKEEAKEATPAAGAATEAGAEAEAKH